jgi:hypothetical protein
MDFKKEFEQLFKGVTDSPIYKDAEKLFQSIAAEVTAPALRWIPIKEAVLVKWTAENPVQYLVATTYHKEALVAKWLEKGWSIDSGEVLAVIQIPKVPQ